MDYEIVNPETDFQRIQFKNFEDAHKILQLAFHDNIKFWSGLFTPWESNANLSLIAQKMEEQLNDDCIRKVLEKLNWTELIQLARFSEHYCSLIQEKSSRFKNFELTSTTFGNFINISNFRFFLQMFGKSLVNFTFSLDSMRTTNGVIYNTFHCFEKYAIIYLIVNFTGKSLKTLNLKSFAIKDPTAADLFRILEERNVKVTTSD